MSISQYFNRTERDYYWDGDHGNYQFTKLSHILSHFEIAYVGEDKLIPRLNRLDLVFHAKRALQELSFDTFKSIKSQSIVLPPTNTMVLPHDYVNYTKLSWIDNSGIKHPMYPTNHTSNPFQVRQTEGEGKHYMFETGANLVINGDFSDTVFGQGTWAGNNESVTSTWSDLETYGSPQRSKPNYKVDEITSNSDGTLQFKQWQRTGFGSTASNSYGIYQRIDVRTRRVINLEGTGTSADQQTNSTAGDIADYGVIRLGITSTNPSTGLKADGSVGWARPPGSIKPATSTTPAQDLSGTAISAAYTHPFSTVNASPNYKSESLDLGYVEWADGSSSLKTLEEIDVTEHDYIWVVIQSYVPFTDASITDIDKWDHNSSGTATMTTAGRLVTAGGCTPASASTGNSFNNNDASINYMDNVVVTSSEEPNELQEKSLTGNSDTWDKYKATTPAENTIDNYEDDTYWPNYGERYGLEPSHAQINGSFFIDDRTGKIYFSSNISGKTIILDYISDSLGTNEEMVVHKFAEEAMYKSILYSVMCGRANVGRGQLMYYKKEKFAAVRNAKLRLSNIKLEEITQILRGKSKHIKH